MSGTIMVGAGPISVTTFDFSCVSGLFPRTSERERRKLGTLQAWNVSA